MCYQYCTTPVFSKIVETSILTHKAIAQVLVSEQSTCLGGPASLQQLRRVVGRQLQHGAARAGARGEDDGVPAGLWPDAA